MFAEYPNASDDPAAMEAKRDSASLWEANSVRSGGFVSSRWLCFFKTNGFAAKRNAQASERDAPRHAADPLVQMGTVNPSQTEYT